MNQTFKDIAVEIKNVNAIQCEEKMCKHESNHRLQCQTLHDLFGLHVEYKLVNELK